MEHVAAKLKAEEGLNSRVVWQTNLPPDLSVFSAVVVYIHLRLNEPAEKAFVAYSQAGGKLVVLHHSISSGKRKNRQWFNFLGVALTEGDVNTGGYKWIEGITQQIVNLAPDHYITTHKVNYPEQIGFKTDADTAERTLPGFTLRESEVYLNHTLADNQNRTHLLGFKYTDKNTGRTYMQSMPDGSSRRAMAGSFICNRATIFTTSRIHASSALWSTRWFGNLRRGPEDILLRIRQAQKSPCHSARNRYIQSGMGANGQPDTPTRHRCLRLAICLPPIPGHDALRFHS